MNLTSISWTQSEAEQLKQRLERLARLQARLIEASIRAKQYALPARADQLFIVLKSAEALNDTAARQQAPVFALNQLETTIQLAERLVKLLYDVSPRVDTHPTAVSHRL